MVREAEVLLGDLDLEHQRRLRHGAEERVERLARLEVDGPVLDLEQDVRREPAVEGLERVVGGRGPVGAGLRVVDEGAPHHHAVVGGQGGGQQVRAVDVAAMVGVRPRLALAAGLDQEAAEVGDEPVDLVRLRLPPRDHPRIERIGRLQAAQLDRRREARGQVDPHAIGAEDVGDGGHLPQVLGAEDLGVGRSHY